MGFFRHFFKRQMIRFSVIWRQFILFLFIVSKNLKHENTRKDQALAFLCHYLSFTSTTLSAPFTRLHILVSTTYLKVILPNSFYYLKDSIKRWYWTQKYQIKYCEMGNCRIQREGWSCYYLCQCLDWNLFSINYLEDLHKLLPS